MRNLVEGKVKAKYFKFHFAHTKFKLPLLLRSTYLAESWTAGSGTEAYGLCWICGIWIPQLIVLVKKLNVMLGESQKSQDGTMKNHM